MTSALGARALLGAPAIATRSKDATSPELGVLETSMLLGRAERWHGVCEAYDACHTRDAMIQRVIIPLWDAPLCS